MHLSNFQIRWMMFMKIFMIITHAEKEKSWLFFIIWLQTLWQIKKIQTIIEELFIRCRKLNISLVFITQSYFSVPKNARWNLTHYLVMKINNKKEFHNIAIDHSADIHYRHFIKIFRECTREPYNFLTIDTTLPATYPLRFRRKLFDSYI